MKTYTLDGVIDVTTGEDYNEDFPTKQTELLSLSLRQVLQDWKENDFELVRAETTDISGLIDELQSQSDDVVSFCSDISEPGITNLPAIPDLGSLVSLITTLLPAILSGSLSIGQIIITLLPNIIEALLALIKRDVVRLPTTPAESDVAAQVGELKDMLENNISFADPMNQGQRISHIEHMAAALIAGLRAGETGSTITQAEQIFENFVTAISGFSGLPDSVQLTEFLNGYDERLENVGESLDNLREMFELWHGGIDDNTFSDYLSLMVGSLDSLGSIRDSLDSIQRWIEEIQAATPVGVMNTSEIDKVIWVRD